MKIEAEGASLEVKLTGDSNKPALLLWHGAGCSLRMWDHVAEKIKDNFFVISFDIRGVGLSSEDGSQSQYTFEKYSEDANCILNYLGLDRVHIWSMAWGTRAAMAYCSLYPKKVISAVFSDASIGTADVEAQKLGAKKAFLKQTELGIKPYIKPIGWNEHLNQETVALALAAAGKFNLKQAMHNLTMPILVMTGDHDPNINSSKEIIGQLKNAELVVLENVGHGSVLQRPDLTSKNVIEFHRSLETEKR
jgi:pimeloyl-ACP methyl ester carboxylesterase